MFFYVFVLLLRLGSTSFFSSINSWSWEVLDVDSKFLLREFVSCVDIYGNIFSRLNTQLINCFWPYLYPFRNKNCHLNQIPPQFWEFLGKHMTFPRFIGYLIGFLLKQFIENIIGRKYCFPPQVLRKTKTYQHHIYHFLQGSIFLLNNSILLRWIGCNGLTNNTMLKQNSLTGNSYSPPLLLLRTFIFLLNWFSTFFL